MYSLKCSYYQREFNTIDELIDDVVSSGMDPSYEITKNGKSIGEMVIDLIGFWLIIIEMLKKIKDYMWVLIVSIVYRKND